MHPKRGGCALGRAHERIHGHSCNERSDEDVARHVRALRCTHGRARWDAHKDARWMRVLGMCTPVRMLRCVRSRASVLCAFELILSMCLSHLANLIADPL